MGHSLTLAATAATLALLAGCGSSKSTTAGSNAAATTQAGATTAAGGSSPYGAAAGSSSTTRAATSPAGAGGTVISAKHSKLGTVLAAGPKKLTVYLFEADTPASSACSGACASVWPPVTTTAAPTSAAGAATVDLGTITRPDGTKQVTYKGHPLYYFAKDKDDGDAYGQGIKSFGSAWYVLSPSGAKVDNS